MPFCAQCGASISPDAHFCEKCGSPAGATQPPPLPGAAPATGGIPENIAAALCYLIGFITGVLFLVLEPYNRNKTIRFHAFQSIFLNVAWVAFWVVSAVVFHRLLFLLAPLISLGFFILWLYLMLKAYQGSKVVLPVIGPMAQQQAG